MSKKVIIEIEADGTTKIDAQGFTDNSCAMATRELELVLAGSPGNVDDKRKPEYNMRPVGATNTNRN